MKKNAETDKSPNMRLFLAQMCEKFTEVFKKMKDLRAMRSALEEENVEIKGILQEESSKLELTLQKLKDDLLKIQEIREELVRKISETQKEALNLSKEKVQRLEYLELLTKEHLEKGGNSNNTDKILKIEAELLNYKGKLEEIKRISEKLDEKERTLSNHIEKLSRIKEDKDRDLKSLQEVLRDYEKNSIEKNVQNHEMMSTYRQNLKENREKMEIIEKKEKILDQLSEELSSKLERLKTIIVNNKNMKTKLSKREENQYIYEKICQENQGLRHEVSELRKNVNSLEGFTIKNGENNQEKGEIAYKQANIDLQTIKNKELKLRIESLSRELQEKDEEIDSSRRKQAINKEKLEDIKKEWKLEEEKNQKLVESYEKMSTNLEDMKQKIKNFIR